MVQEVHKLDQMGRDFSRLVGNVSDTLTLEDFAGDDASEAIAKLTDEDLAAEVTHQLPRNKAMEVEAADSENISPPTSSEAGACLALV